MTFLENFSLYYVIHFRSSMFYAIPIFFCIHTVYIGYDFGRRKTARCTNTLKVRYIIFY